MRAGGNSNLYQKEDSLTSFVVAFNVAAEFGKASLDCRIPVHGLDARADPLGRSIVSDLVTFGLNGTEEISRSSSQRSGYSQTARPVLQPTFLVYPGKTGLACPAKPADDSRSLKTQATIAPRNPEGYPCGKGKQVWVPPLGWELARSGSTKRT